MKRIVSISLLTVFGFLVIFSVAAQAETHPETTERMRSNSDTENADEPRLKNLVQVDLIPLLDQGYGFSFERAFSNRLLVGPYFSISKLQGLENSSTFELKSEVTVFGVGARYFIDDFELGTFYFQAGVGRLRAKTEGVGNYLGSAYGSASQSISAVQYQAGVGFQFQGWELSDGLSLVANIAAGVSNSSTVESKTALYSDRSMTLETAPKAGLLGIAAIGLLF